jgi:hypothetical protein
MTGDPRRQRSVLVLVLRANLRQTAGPLVPLALAVALVWSTFDSFHGFHHRDDWFLLGDYFSEAVEAFGLPMAASFGCWQGGMESRNDAGWIRRTAARTSVSQTLVRLAPTVVWPMAGHLLAALVVLAQPLSGAYVSPPFEAMTADAMALTAMACVGFWLGQRLAGPVIPFVVAVAVLAFWGSPWSERVSDLMEPHYVGPALPAAASAVVYAGPAEWVPWCRPVLFAGVTAAVVLVCARRRTAAVVLTMALMTGQTLLMLSEEDSGARSAPRVELRCTGGTPALCVSEEYEPARRQLEPYVEQLAVRLRGVRGAPTHYVLTDNSFPSDIGRTAPTSEDAPWAIAVSPNRFDLMTHHLDPGAIGDMVCVIARGTYHSGACAPGPTSLAVVDWLAHTPNDRLTAGQRRQVARIEALSPKARTAWFGTYLAAVKRGDPPPPPPPADRT